MKPFDQAINIRRSETRAIVIDFQNDRFRISVLNAQTDDAAFHKRYQELQVMANLDDFQEFLKEKYFL